MAHHKACRQSHQQSIALTPSMINLEPMIEEVELAVDSLKNGKAPGLDQIAAEAIKAGGDVLRHRIHLFIQLIWRLDKIPSRWK